MPGSDIGCNCQIIVPRPKGASPFLFGEATHRHGSASILTRLSMDLRFAEPSSGQKGLVRVERCWGAEQTVLHTMPPCPLIIGIECKWDDTGPRKTGCWPFGHRPCRLGLRKGI